jgi:hypothetical protein
MRLELHWSHVESLTAGATTRLLATTLEVNLDELRALLEADARLAAPGARIRRSELRR